MKTAVVFAYHDVGVRCLSVLLAGGVDVRLIVTHQDDPQETIWFASVSRLARWHGIPVVTPDRADDPDLLERVRAAQPDFLFSFYYRYMLGDELLSMARRAALNMHGSLLPRYRGRVPINWAIIHGETETGASLHHMASRPDAGDLVDQMAVPILTNDTALDVFRKVTVAAELVMWRSLPGVLEGTAPSRPLDLTRGSYHGRRGPEDGRIDPAQAAWDIHNLIRAVAPPYPGAFFDTRHGRWQVLGSYFRAESARGEVGGKAALYGEAGRIYLDCSDGKRLELTALQLDGRSVDAASLDRLAGPGPVLIGE